MVVHRRGRQKSIERIAMFPFHRPGHDADRRIKAGDAPALLIKQFRQSTDERRHFGPFAEPHFLSDLKKRDRTNQDGFRITQSGSGLFSQTIVAF